MNDSDVITARSLTLLAEAAGRKRDGSALQFLTDELVVILRDGGGYRDPVGAAYERIDAAYDRGAAAQRREDRQRDIDAFAERAIAAS